NIRRLYGQAEAVSFEEEGFAEKAALFPDFPKVRTIFTAKIDRIQDSCGWGVPFYDFAGERDQLVRVNAHRTDEEWKEKRYAGNAVSIDGLPGLEKPEAAE
ncbi:MAG: pyridoxamine 5'-phosphate oxidase family protein, partial [Alphaproteobacteria bacterium]|nr:pyridoxamine 5'-phosphate oxidase family protein [Alphaproteobacteria bacterium]